MHVHLREPGREDTETIETGSKAAAKGGFTAVFFGFAMFYFASFRNISVNFRRDIFNKKCPVQEHRARGITVSPEQVEKALPQAVLTTCLDEKGKQEILDKPGWF